jgi:hypothetical protein
MRSRPVELILLFALLPLSLLALRSSGIRVLPLPVLWLASGFCLYLLWQGKVRLGQMTGPAQDDRPSRQGVLIELLISIAICSLLLLALYPLISNEQMFRFPRERPLVWVIVLVLYPLLSVVPQGIVFRRWFLARYHSFLGNGWLMILVGAVCFGFSHILFGNFVAPLVTFVGGLLFMRTFLRTGSGWLADLQHAVLGDVAFTIGYGQWLYSGSAA